MHRKPIGVLNVNGYYDGLAALFDHAVREQFIRAPHRSSLHIESSGEALLERFAGWEPPTVRKWLELEEG
jgi:predicted Rossmann-fold nucleotide-binding protein